MDGLRSTNISPFLIDINQLDNSVKPFLDSDILIINITSKNKVSFAELISEIERSRIEKVIFISSTSVYNSTNSVVTEEGGAESQESVLFQIENLFRNNTSFQTTIVRLAGLIGYQRHPGRFFLNGKKVQQPDAPVNLIHRDDCIGIVQAIIKQEIWGETFSACADNHPTKREFYGHARRLLELDAPELAGYEQLQFKLVSNDKVKAVLDYRFKYPDIMAIPFDGDS